MSRGTISHLQLVLMGPGCTALVKGTSNPGAAGVVAVSYASKTGRLKVLPTGGNLHWEPHQRPRQICHGA